MFCNISLAVIVYMIDFKCNKRAYKVFAYMTLDELDGQFLQEDSDEKLARYHDLSNWQPE